MNTTSHTSGRFYRAIGCHGNSTRCRREQVLNLWKARENERHHEFKIQLRTDLCILSLLILLILLLLLLLLLLLSG